MVGQAEPLPLLAALHIPSAAGEPPAHRAPSLLQGSLGPSLLLM